MFRRDKHMTEKIKATINPIQLKYTTRFVEDNSLVKLLLYGDEKFKLEDNQNILKATIEFIRDSARFSQM